RKALARRLRANPPKLASEPRRVNQKATISSVERSIGFSRCERQLRPAGKIQRSKQKQRQLLRRQVVAGKGCFLYPKALRVFIESREPCIAGTTPYCKTIVVGRSGDA